MKAEAQTKIAVKNLTFQLMPGEVLGLLGPNGAGKSTTLNMLTAEITPDAGMVCCCNSKYPHNSYLLELIFFDGSNNIGKAPSKLQNSKGL